MAERKISLSGNGKVAIIGSGFVGSSIAYALALRDIAREIVLIDIDRSKCVGEAADIRYGIPSIGTSNVTAGDYSDCADCDLIIITAGRNRLKGESRSDLAADNVEILHEVIDEMRRYYTRGVVLIISNPVDILTYKADRWMGLPNGMVFGTGCLLDTSRFVRTVADHLGVSTSLVNGYLVGEHGDGQVPIWSRVTVDGIPVEEYCSVNSVSWNSDIKRMIAEKTKAMGTEIIKAKGKTHYGIATCVCYLANAIINRHPVITTVSSVLLGEHGVKDVALSVPSVVGAAGVQRRIRERWEPDEYKAFTDAAEKVGNILSKVP